MMSVFCFDFLLKSLLTATKKKGTNAMPTVIATAMPKNTPVPMSRRAAEPGPEAKRRGRRPSMNASEVMTIGRNLSLVGLLLGEFHYKDGVLCDESDKHHKSDLEIDVVFESANPYPKICAYPGNRQRQNHRQWHRPTLIQGRQEEKDEKENESEHEPGVAAFMFLLVGKAAPFHSNIVGQMLLHDSFESVHCLSRAISMGSLSRYGG